MPQVLDPNAPLPRDDFGTAKRRLRYGDAPDPADRTTAPLVGYGTAEVVVRALEARGCDLVLVVSAEGRPDLALLLPIFPPSFHDRSALALARYRFRTEDRFAREMFGVLDVAGRVYAARPARGFSIDFDKRDVL